jgi:DNA-binding protein H-NS
MENQEQRPKRQRTEEEESAIKRLRTTARTYASLISSEESETSESISIKNNKSKQCDKRDIRVARYRYV